MIAPTQTPAPEPSTIRSTLIVEDLPETQRWLETVVTEAFPASEMTLCSGVSDALAALKTASFDLALIDLGLDDGYGTEVLHACRTHASPPHCVVTTIFDDDRNLFAALKAGAQGYLLKDQPASSLVSGLRGIIDGQPPLSPSVARRLLKFFVPDDAEQQHLSPRESEVLTLIAKGCTVSEVARMLTLKPNTVAGYVKEIYRKLHVGNRAEAALEAMRRGMI
jgi:DNA-binding NarL/FixJ family response regulator